MKRRVLAVAAMFAIFASFGASAQVCYQFTSSLADTTLTLNLTNLPGPVVVILDNLGTVYYVYDLSGLSGNGVSGQIGASTGRNTNFSDSSFRLTIGNNPSFTSLTISLELGAGQTGNPPDAVATAGVTLRGPSGLLPNGLLPPVLPAASSWTSATIAESLVYSGVLVNQPLITIDSITSLSGCGTGQPTALITPQVGLWWNPAESGTGYALDYKHGVLVVTVYSYTAAGAPIWYLAFGPVINNTFTSTLNKFQNGQCISCAYSLPTINGNDGTISITFTSPTTATMTLPGGRNFQIVPQAF
jgi:hypothetical protein